MLSRIILIVFFIVSINCFSNSFSYLGGENGDYWIQGNSVNIKIPEDIFKDNVVVKLWNAKQGNYTVINEVDNGTTSFIWEIPNDYPTGNIFKLRLEEKNNKRNFIMSETFFPIYKNTIQLQKESNEYYNDGKSYSISLYPNPTSDNLNIKSNFKTVYYIKIINMLGNIVLSELFTSNSVSINLSEINKGIYFVEISNDNNKYIEKLIVQ